MRGQRAIQPEGGHGVKNKNRTIFQTDLAPPAVHPLRSQASVGDVPGGPTPSVPRTPARRAFPPQPRWTGAVRPCHV